VAGRQPDDTPSGSTATGTPGGRLRGAAAVKLHVTLAVGLTICVGAFIIEVGRALGGNSLSWAYVFEWPIFAVFAIYMWWNLLHDRDGSRQGPSRRERRQAERAGADSGSPATSASEPEDVDPDLMAWQAYLATMEADEAKDPDSPGGR
jgi:hypothetical protein